MGRSNRRRFFSYQSIVLYQTSSRNKRGIYSEGAQHMSKRDLALDSLTRICEIQQRLINQLIAMEQNSYARGYEDGMAAQAEVDIALNEMAVKSETI
jgi:hypothetical protein